MTLADLEAWHDRTLKGKLIVGISGDFDPAAMEAKVRAAFEGLPPVTPAPPRHDVFAGPEARRLLHRQGGREPVERGDCGLGHQTAAIPTCPRIAVMNEILGGGFGSRLFQKVRTELGLAYAVGGGFGLPTTIPAPSAWRC